MVLAGLLIGIPVIHRELRAMTKATPGLARDLAQTDAWQWLNENTGIGDGLIRGAQSFVTSAPSLLTSLISTTVGTIFNLAMITLAVLFLLSSGSKAVTLMVRIAPGLATARGWDVVAETYQSIGRYVIGAVAQATIAGVVVALMLTLVDVPYAIALGLVTFFWDFIPMIGSTIAAIPCVIVAYGSQGLETAIFVGIFITAFTQVENSILQPRIQGGAASLPGAAIFFSVLVGGSLFGIAGAILAVPAASVISTILQHWFEHRGVATLEPPVLFDERGHVLRQEP
jgi:predicted PurR-regulated permease PerM